MQKHQIIRHVTAISLMHIVSAMAKKRPDNIPQKAAVATGTMPSRSSSKRSVKKKSGGYSKRE
jgi:hypothetical protein